MARGFVYLVAVMDWFSRRVLAWRVSITLATDFCVAALGEAMTRYGQPEIVNTDQGVQFPSAAFVDGLATRGVRISMDGKRRFLDTLFIERLWRSLKYEAVLITAYGSVAEARLGIGGWLRFYNDDRRDQAATMTGRTRRWAIARRGRCSRMQPVNMWTTLPLR